MATCQQTTIYVGLRDSSTHEQRYDTTKYLDMLRNVCRNYRVPFSVSQMKGGYFHEDGTYVEENSLVLTLIDAPDDVIEQMALDLCTFFHQEKVMVTSAPASVYYVSSALRE